MVTGDDLDRGVRLQAGLRGRLLAVRQERHDAAAFEIADQGAVVVVASPGEVAHADDAERIGLLIALRRMTRRSVSRLTGSMRRWARLAPGRPPSARPRRWTTSSSCEVRRAKAGRTSSGKRSAKIFALR